MGEMRMVEGERAVAARGGVPRLWRCICIDKRVVHCRAMKGHGARVIRNKRDRRDPSVGVALATANGSLIVEMPAEPACCVSL